MGICYSYDLRIPRLARFASPASTMHVDGDRHRERRVHTPEEIDESRDSRGGITSGWKHTETHLETPDQGLATTTHRFSSSGHSSTFCRGRLTCLRRDILLPRSNSKMAPARRVKRVSVLPPSGGDVARLPANVLGEMSEGFGEWCGNWARPESPFRWLCRSSTSLLLVAHRGGRSHVPLSNRRSRRRTQSKEMRQDG